jgi:hypothetical protein
MSERICGVLAPGFRWEADSKNELRMESRKSDGRSREEKFAYPWAMAPTINMTKPVATAIATFVSIDKLIIFPFSYASLRIWACLWTPGAGSSAYFP